MPDSSILDRSQYPPMDEVERGALQREAWAMLGSERWETWFPPVAVSYATNNRPGIDVKGAGPGITQLVLILRALHAEGIGCASGLAVPVIDGDWRTFLTKIHSRFGQCKVLIVLMTPALFKSGACLKEIDHAHKAGLHILPLKCDYELPLEAERWTKAEAIHADMLEHGLAATRLNCLPATGHFFDTSVAEHMATLIDVLKQHIGAAAALAVPPPQAPPPPQVASSPASTVAVLSPEQQLALVMERRAARKQQERRISKYPFVTPPTKAAIDAQSTTASKRALSTKLLGTPTASPETSSTGTLDSTPTIMTITIDGSLEGFDCDAFTAKLALRLDMHRQQFLVKRIKRRGVSPHRLSTESGLSITVDIDEEGYLEHDSEGGTSSGNDGRDVCELTDEERQEFDAYVTLAIKKALKPLHLAAGAIQVRWTESGSIIVCIELELPHALKLLDLVKNEDEELMDTEWGRIRSCVLGEHYPRDKHEMGGSAEPSAEEVSADEMNQFHSALRTALFAPSHFAALGLQASANPNARDINRAYRASAKACHQTNHS